MNAFKTLFSWLRYLFALSIALLITLILTAIFLALVPNPWITLLFAFLILAISVRFSLRKLTAEGRPPADNDATTLGIKPVVLQPVPLLGQDTPAGNRVVQPPPIPLLPAPLERSPYALAMKTLRPKFERDLNDTLIFLKELLLVLWRFNPASLAGHAVLEMFNRVGPNTPNSEKAALISQVLPGIEVPPVATFEKDFEDMIREVSTVGASETIKGAVSIYPSLEQYLKDLCCASDCVASNSFVRQTLTVLERQRPHYQRLAGCYEQLSEYLPRYSSIMTRTGVLDTIIGFAAGFLGGYLGAVGAGVWENWRDSNDNEFCQKFGAALDDFMQSCVNYCTEGEESLNIVFDKIIDEVRDLERKVFDAYEELAEAGWDIEPLYQQYRTPTEAPDENLSGLYSIALQNLEQNRSIHYRTIENIRSIVGIAAA